MKSALRIEVLGCHGGEMAGFLAPSLLINDRVLLDAGSFSTVLSLERQLCIDHVLLSHAHADHVKDLAGFADLIIGRRKRPVLVHASAGALRTLHEHFFNNQFWPDFFSLPSPDAPVLRAVEFKPRHLFRIGRLRVVGIPVSHPVETVGFIIRGPSGAFAYSGDTGPTDELWRRINRTRSLRLVLIETKFPNSLALVADAAGHLTPHTLTLELNKLHVNGIPLVLYHLKPDRLDELEREIRAIGDPRLRLMQIGDVFRV